MPDKTNKSKSKILIESLKNISEVDNPRQAQALYAIYKQMKADMVVLEKMAKFYKDAHIKGDRGQLGTDFQTYTEDGDIDELARNISKCSSDMDSIHLHIESIFQ